ncbi:A/G-specific adenine glycosylase [Ruania halotolerans]|uniref:A/G-specific adenine glycosylase n=1 Tax=Ruania halotolerans TaxID=2897773 RepID=UPI001E65C10A|nr:A/G-specific adenine glycosylase [Ruania halotolerans]UFU05844.1 A/G-specific adenine glycosylase [Ruania halotolerans]
MSTVRVPATAAATLHSAVVNWYATHARDLPWRAPHASAWSVLVSEIMLQQTPVVRVEPAWRAWMQRWPTPADLAAASPAEVLRAWDRLGYPRRALRLREAAAAITEHHDGEVPADEEALLALPGIGSYTAAAVAAFAFRRRSVVLDTNVRRVLGRLLSGTALPPPSPRRTEAEMAAEVLPADPEASARWNVAVMELGALVCTARSPRCGQCPVADQCQWRTSGYPADEHAARRRTQAWHGTDRQARGRVLAALRTQDELRPEEVRELWPDATQLERVLTGLRTDGLVSAIADLDGVVTGYRLPQG